MGLDLTNPLVQLKVTEVICGVVAVGMTCGRMYIRRARYWWDDGWAFMSMIFLFVQVAAVFMHVPNPAELSKPSRIAAYYIMASTFYAVIWSARLSILFSIMRIEPNPIAQRRLRYVSYSFIFCACFLIAQLFWVCEPEPKWKNLPSPQCKLTNQVAVCQVVTDVISDMFLCLAPLRLIQNIQSASLRRRLKVIFSTSIVTTIVSLVHVVYLLTIGSTQLVIAALVEDCVSLIVANIPVVITASLRMIDPDEDDLNQATPGRKVSTMGFRTKQTQLTVAATATTASADTDLDDHITTKAEAKTQSDGQVSGGMSGILVRTETYQLSDFGRRVSDDSHVERKPPGFS